jgi:DNA-binding MarR family transcriptional regulator
VALVDDFGLLCRTMHRRVTHRVALESKRPFQQLRALRAIDREQIDTQNALAERLCIDASATSRLVATLEKEGLLVRAPGEDRRCVRLRVTRKAKREVETMSDALDWMDREVRRHLTAGEAKSFARVLAKLNDVLADEEI